jgi:hypothetical protein
MYNVIRLCIIQMLRHGFFGAEALVQSQGSPHVICGRHNITEIGSSLTEIIESTWNFG